jgi:glyoxylase-like metal-dependent hydrolase (beta-lactamase superfamily II)
VSEAGVRQLAAGLWCVGQRKGGRVHAFLCEDDGELTLVDTLYALDGARIIEQIRRIGRQPSALRRIVLTHGHRSHLGGLAALKDASGATVYAHEWEADIIGGERKAQPISFLPHRPFRTYFPFQFGLSLGIGAHPPCPVDEFVAGGDRVGPLEVLDAPGHSPGHLAFLWADRRALIAGDSIATWPSFMAGWAAFNLNVPKHRATIRLLAETEPEALGVGHGPPITHGATARVRDLADAFAR